MAKPPRPRRMSVAKLKSAFVRVVRSLARKGAVEVTRRGRVVAILAPAARRKAPLYWLAAGKIDTDAGRFAELVAAYAAGDVTWRQIALETGAAFGDVLVELGRQGLSLPVNVTEPASVRPEVLAALGSGTAGA